MVPEYELVLADASAIHGLEQAETNPRDPVWTFAVGIVQIAIGASAGATAITAPHGDVPAHSGSAR